MDSSSREKRSAIGTPAAAKSSTYSPPAPTPTTTRPPDARSMSASCFATTDGMYQGSTSVAVPTTVRRVCSTRRASHINGSGDGLWGGAVVPPPHAESTPNPPSRPTASAVGGATTPISSGMDPSSAWSGSPSPSRRQHRVVRLVVGDGAAEAFQHRRGDRRRSLERDRPHEEAVHHPHHGASACVVK